MDDLINEFLVETNESLESLDLDIVRLEQDPDDMEIIRNIFRVMHTIKGTCGFLGLPRMESVAHAAENIMDQLRDNKFKVTPEITSLILEAIDVVKNIIECIEETEAEPEGNDKDLIERLNICAETGMIGGHAQTPGTEILESPLENIAGTPDLDEDIDFEPIPAPEADISEGGAPETEMLESPLENVVGTPDLDEDIDFEPIPAPEADISEEKTNVPALEGKTNLPTPKEPEISLSAKEKAIEQGLKVAEQPPVEQKKTVAGKSIRVNLDILESLMQMVGELVLTRNQLLQITGNNESTGESAAPLQRLNLITSELQEGVMQTRMQPIGNAWAKFPRLVRDLSIDVGKKIELRMIGAETDLDRQMLEAIKDPLTHMVRNSVDHGIEEPEDRTSSGKSMTGILTLSAYHEGGHIIIKVSDDGRGLSIEKIKKKAVENGLATEIEVESMSNKQIFQFVFRAGFSTAQEVTAISGRGVGMDVVVNNIEKIGGTVEVDSWEGKGSEFLIKLPLTLAIMPVLIIESAGEKFAIPQIRVSEIVRADATGDDTNDDIGYKVETIDNAPVLRLRGHLLPLISLSKTLQLSREVAYSDDDATIPDIEPFIVVCEVGSQNFGILVDKVYDTEEIVVKPVSKILKYLAVYSGCTILGDGSVILILDPNGIIKTSGVTGIREKDSLTGRDAASAQKKMVSFLLFKAWGKSPKAIPLELVSRLEEIDASLIEWSGDQPVVQYRGKLMRIITPDSSVPIPEKGMHEVIVFADENRIMGLVVEEIIDIVKQEMDIKSITGRDGMLGSMVVKGITTDLLDVSYFFSQVFSDWLGKPEALDSDDSINNNPHILLVDDSPFFRKFMKPVLVTAGYNVSTAENALIALEILEKYSKQFDLVITDIDMPEMNGIEFTAKCKADNRFSKLPFIALSSHVESELGGSVKELGFETYVSKSDRDNLVAAISETLSSLSEVA